MRIARQARSEKSKKLFQIFSRQRSKRDPRRQSGEMGGAFENVGCTGEGSLALREEVDHLNEKQEMFTILMEAKMGMQKVAPEKYQEKIFEELRELEEQETREALELVQRKHKFVTWAGQRERARRQGQ